MKFIFSGRAVACLFLGVPLVKINICTSYYVEYISDVSCYNLPLTNSYHCLQDDLDEMVATWNRHMIRPTKNARIPSGRPNSLYQLPQLYNTIDYLSDVSQTKIQVCRDESIFSNTIMCDQDIDGICCIHKLEEHFQKMQTRQSICVKC